MNIYPGYPNISLKVPFDLKEVAKRNGMRWNPDKKCWYKQIYLGYNDDIEGF